MPSEQAPQAGASNDLYDAFLYGLSNGTPQTATNESQRPTLPIDWSTITRAQPFSADNFYGVNRSIEPVPLRAETTVGEAWDADEMYNYTTQCPCSSCRALRAQYLIRRDRVAATIRDAQDIMARPRVFIKRKRKLSETIKKPVDTLANLISCLAAAAKCHEDDVLCRPRQATSLAS